MNECNDLLNLTIASGMLWIGLAAIGGLAVYRLSGKLKEMTEDRDWWMKHSGGPRL